MKQLRKLLKEYPLLITWISTAGNLIYAGIHLLLGTSDTSYWHITMSTYFLILGLLRLAAGTAGRKQPEKIMRVCGFGIILLSIVLCGVSVLVIRHRINPSYNRNIMLAYAAYSFILITAAVINVIKARVLDDTNFRTIRHLSLVSAIGVMLAMERAMLGTYGIPEDSFTVKIEAGTGGFAAVTVLLAGIHLILTARRKKKESLKDYEEQRI
ncbi:MAG: hypothetical protein E7190_11290 [Erysipelotrichaceae bacterium]|nr:hypothetical protein [Erysipelotrichaceae bacterium]